MNSINLLCVMLTVLFAGLKLTGYIAWSWWLVFLPIYGPALVVLGVIICLAAVIAIGESFSR